MPTPSRPARDRSEPVRAAIRASAERLFRRQGFESTGVREIAADAGVNPAIVIRHFGSKEALFLDTVRASESMIRVFSGPTDRLGFRLVEWVVGRRDRRDPTFAALMRASDRPEVARRLRDDFLDRLVDHLVGRIDAPDAELRAHLFTAQFTGLMAAISVAEDRFLRSAPAEDIVANYGEAMQRILTGSPSSPVRAEPDIRS